MQILMVAIDYMCRTKVNNNNNNSNKFTKKLLLELMEYSNDLMKVKV